MQDEILKDFIIYRSIEILKGNIKVEYNKEDDKILKIYYKFQTQRRNINGETNKTKVLYSFR